MTDNKVYLECIKEGKKLRVKIISPGYNNNANGSLNIFINKICDHTIDQLKKFKFFRGWI